jgi:predicted NBD/HSP70 family sugar kinase
MYLGIDVGATKTLFAVFDAGGEMICEKKIKTHEDYDNFKTDVAAELKKLNQFKLTHCCCALPGWFDFKTGTALAFGRLPWKNVAIKSDLQTMMPGVKVLYHNDAKLAGFSEAALIIDKYKKVLYITISTGIGGGVIINGEIARDFENFEPGQMLFEHDGKTEKWENFASGRALKEHYGKLASEIENPAIWREYVKTLTVGFEDLLATVQPEAVVVGGGVGAHFEKFKSYLEEELNKINNPLVPVPPLLKAQRPEEAVIYGCYDYIKQNL